MSMGEGKIQFQVRLDGRSGYVTIAWNAREQITAIDWSFERTPLKQALPIPFIVADLVDRFRGYFEAGKPIGGVPWEHLDQTDWTEFQRQAFSAIAKIPHGETRTYGWVAEKIGRVFATRAVGQALRNNPLPILIPCHRVVSASSLGGFMGVSDPQQPELLLKQQLLSVEDRYRSPLFDFMIA